MINYNEKQKATIIAFEQFFKEPLITALGGGSFEQIEGINTLRARKLDVEDGVDYIFTDLQGNTKKFGSRIQWDIDYRTFTMRKEIDGGIGITEFDKRCKKPDDNHYTFHGYFDRDIQRIMSFAVALTDDIVKMINMKFYEIRHTGITQSDPASFYAVKWSVLKYQLFTEHSYETKFPIRVIN